MTLNRVRQFLLVILQALYLVCIWTPNIVIINNVAPYLVAEEKLQCHLRTQCDFFINAAKYYACSQIAKDSPNEIWNTDKQQDWFRNYLKLPKSIDLYTANKLTPAQYTPQTIAIFMPLSQLSLHEAISIFNALSFLCMLIPVTILLRRSSKPSGWQIILWWLVVLAAAPVTENFCLGQVNGFLSGLAAIFLLNWQSKNPIWAALALALTIAIKPHRALVLFIMSLAAKKFKLLFITAVCSLLLLGITVSVLGLEPVLYYPKALLTIERAIDNHLFAAPTTAVVSILAPIAILFGSHAARVASLPFTFINLLLIYIIWRKAVLVGKQTYAYAYASSVLCNFILGPHEHFYDLVLLSVVWAVTGTAVEINDVWKIKETEQRFWSFLFLFFPILTWLIYFSSSRPETGYFGPWHLPVLILLFSLALLNFGRSIKSAP